ncbi:hypothetical protein BJX63DRAFT_409940 [Aspergillus granulosus]|uniref:Uncharacterized protein n=1 Tax=Aspergillus granulosus TaxID=176169 RepID=A0ABR4GYI4_9EURO
MVQKGQEKQFVFVGGPALTTKGDGIRSKLIQDGIREKKLQRRRIAVAEMNKLIKERTYPECICRLETNPLMRSRSIKAWEPSIEGPVADLLHCSFCSKYIRSRGPLLTGGSVQDIGSGHFDPMIPINGRISQLRVREILSFATLHIFPNLRPLATAELYQAWVFPFDDELRLYAFLWSSKYQENVLRLTYSAPEDPAGMKEQHSLKGLTLGALHQEINTYTGQKQIDSIIMCMLVLALNETAGERIYRDQSPFAPTFTGLHGLEIYGSRDPNPHHWKVMHELLGKYGGLESLRIFGLAWQVSLADLTNAVHTLRKPLYPLVDVYGQLLELDPPLVLFAPFGGGFSSTDGKLQTPGSGFKELLSLDPPVYKQIVTVLSNVGELSHVIHYMSMQPCGPRLLDLLADSRDLVHHRLFSLPDENDAAGQILQLNHQSADNSPEQSRELYLICRLAMHLYVTHVTFPVPRPAAVRGLLLQRLCPRLQAVSGQGVSSALLLWCVSVALIASGGAENFDEIWILFKKLCRDLNMTSLDTLLNTLRTFAWVDSAVQHHYTRITKDFFCG